MFLMEVDMASENENILISMLLKRDIISINENKTVFDAIKSITQNKIGELPVINNQMKLSWIIS